MNTRTSAKTLTTRICAALLLIVAAGMASVLCLVAGAFRLIGIHSFLDRLLADWPGLALIVLAMIGMWGFPRLGQSLRLWVSGT